MKKALYMLLIIFLAVSVFSCSDDDETSPDESDANKITLKMWFSSSLSSSYTAPCTVYVNDAEVGTITEFCQSDPCASGSSGCMVTSKIDKNPQGDLQITSYKVSITDASGMSKMWNGSVFDSSVYCCEYDSFGLSCMGE